MGELQAWEIDFSAPRAADGARLLAVGDLVQAKTIWAAAAREFPKTPGTHYNLAIVQQASGEFELAAAGYREALRLDPGYSRAAKELQALESRLAGDAPE